MTAGAVWCHFVLLLLLCTTALWTAEISCRNEGGETVDWFLLYKLPKHTESENAGLGLEYMYMDSLTHAWQLSKYLVNMTQSALGQTLKQLYETYESKNNSIAYAIYNDEIPHSKSYNWKKGHTKGFLLLDKSQGFWGIHSVPLFPPFLEDGYAYPPTGKPYGQVAICITFKYDQFTEIDIYVAWVAQELKTDLLAESWQHSGHRLPSNCSLQYHVYNIHLIGTPLNLTFYSSNDHSKWCVSRIYEDQWTCIGDLNRAAEQAWRSGGFICTQNQYIYKAFRHLVIHYESCNDSPTWI
ncbi:deoxyribonuclease-2-beta isoform X2 [Dromaius novaehollandiae]|uniref:deoxyribonuclease-2-beta isoform X2 n=1 Tax=Dromaius novaehollandiae TaxID=8790 RepID=UPI000E1E3F5A|nr:deoxyribonuclease-2-beta isoform X2 [Dromaius novaehollandiae]